MSRIYHGRIDLKWCGPCGSPVLRGRICPVCGGELREVSITPPGDIQPAFPFDTDLIERTVDGQWGKGTFSLLDRAGGPVLLNPCPAPDRLLEVIIEGHVVGSLKYDLQKGRYSFLLREFGGMLLRSRGHRPSTGWVMADDSAVPFLLEGKNLMSPGIADVDGTVEPMDEVLVLDESGNITGSGTARKGADDMVGTRGPGVKMRWCSVSGIAPPKSAKIPASSFQEIWDRVVEVNRDIIEKDVDRSISFIKRTVEQYGLPPAVSFSGGKDSLATLLLALDAGLVPPILFVDTGLEFPETVDHVRKIVEELDLELIVERPATGFYEELDTFGPPGRDHRWCCKVCKLGPMSNLINREFPHGVLTLIGQRRYESESRRSKGPVWKNPWVPGQVGASPIQDWNALSVWLYIFSKGSDYNPLYNRGFQRIGCWLCPSCDMAESELVAGTGADTAPWHDYLGSYKTKNDLSDEWIEYGFHRFKVLPPHMKKLAKELGIRLDDLRPRGRPEGDGIIELVEGSSSCVDGLSREGRIGSAVPWPVLRELVNIMGPVNADPETGGISVRPEGWPMARDMVEVFPDGTLIIRGTDPRSLEKSNGMFLSIVKRASRCTGCSICVARCPRGALRIQEGHVRLDEELCEHCGSCLGPCPAESFTEDPFDV